MCVILFNISSILIESLLIATIPSHSFLLVVAIEGVEIRPFGVDK